MEVTAEKDDPLHPFRSELRAHCYRVLGSFHDAEDVLQEVSLRAWRGRPSFEGRSSLRTWLHRIAVNACLNELDRKERRVLPVELGPEGKTGDPLAEPLEALWLEPFPDDPQQRSEDRESVELAFVAAVQHLPANQRVALIMFDVLGFSATEVADAMATSPAAVNSALQRARERVGPGLPEHTQQATLAALGADGQRGLVERYSTAFEQRDLGGLLSLLTEDATWSMPPIPTWFRGHEAIASFLSDGPLREGWRHLPTYANGQLAVGCYMWDDTAEAHVAFALDVLEVRGDRISSVIGFLQGVRFPAFGLPEVFPTHR